MIIHPSYIHRWQTRPMTQHEAEKLAVLLDNIEGALREAKLGHQQIEGHIINFNRYADLVVNMKSGLAWCPED